MPTTFSSFSDGDVIHASHVAEMHDPIQNLERGAAFYAGTSSGSTTAYSVTLSPAPDSPHVEGMIVNFKVHSANGPAPTLDVNGVGARPILKNGGQPLAVDDLKVNQIVSVLFDSAAGGSFQLLASAGSEGADLFGDGSDGNVSLSSGTNNLTRDMYYNNLTLSGTAKIRSNGYRLFVAGVLDLSAAGLAAIQYDGVAASGITGGAARAANTVGGGTAGSNGVSGGSGSGSAAAAASSLDPANGGHGGGTQASGSGSNAGVASSPGSLGSHPTDLRVASLHLLRGASLIGAGVGGRGGSSGGGDGTNTGGSGGGGGGAAGVLAIFAHTISTSASTPVSVIRAVGGDGAAAVAPTAGDCGGGSGGGGGGGGFVYLVCQQRVGSNVTAAIRARGGDGGNGSAATGSGTPGAGGDGGGGGQIIYMHLANQTVSINTGNRAAQPGGAPVGPTPGTGGVGRSANADL